MECFSCNTVTSVTILMKFISAICLKNLNTKFNAYIVIKSTEPFSLSMLKKMLITPLNYINQEFEEKIQNELKKASIEQPSL